MLGRSSRPNSLVEQHYFVNALNVVLPILQVKKEEVWKPFVLTQE